MESLDMEEEETAGEWEVPEDDDKRILMAGLTR